MQTEEMQSGEEVFVLPASYAQQRLWFLDRLEPNSAAYNVPLASRLRGPLDVAALEQALNVLVERHEALRTVFTLVDGTPQQLIAPSRPLSMPIIDVTDAADAWEQARALVNDHAREPFDLSADQLIRAVLVRIGDDDHVLSLTVHHIVADAWSLNVLNRELSAVYNALVHGREPHLRELEIQYGDYAVWQQQWMESGGLDQQLSYWTQQLAGAPALLELPTDHPRPPEQSFRGATERAMLPRELLERLRSIGEREGATLFMTLLAAYMTMLARYSGQDDIVVASPVANRNRVELEGVIGLFVNTLALRVDLGEDPSFVGLLQRVRETALAAFSNQDLPFERLVQELNPVRDRRHAPVAQVLFVVQNDTGRPAALEGLQLERVPAERGTAKFDLALFAAETADGLRISIEYCSDLFDTATIARMLEHYRVLLESIASDPSRPIGELELLAPDERTLILDTWNATDADFPAERCIHELVAEQARRTPDDPAVSLGPQTLSYAELDARADRLAHHLRSLGVGPDAVVAISVDRSIEMAVAVLGVLKAGGAYAPIDPSYPPDRVAFMLSDAATSVLLTKQTLVSRLPSHDGHTICLDSDWETIAAGGDRGPIATGVAAENLAYVIYTSGSTGQPKGVAMGHRALVNLLAWQRGSASQPAAARTLQFASLSFDVAFQEIFSTWCTGGELVLTDDDTRRNAHALVELLADAEIERLFLPFVALQGMCEAAEHMGVELPALRDVITAGEQLKITVPVRRFFTRHAGCRLFNHYGPTESHVVTSFELPAARASWPELPPIGRPIANARIYLLDRHRRPAPIGVAADLYIGGVSLARGYLNRAELTEERFVPDPFSRHTGARLYRTGDRARYLPDGQIEFLGRADDQVKVRGFRVELGEIEAGLTAHPDVVQAVAALREDEPGDVRLVGYVVTRSGNRADQLDLLDHTRRLLPEHMIPQHFVSLETVPLTPSGKVDRKSLPAPDGRSRSSGGYTAPDTDLERSLAEIWRRLLKIDRVGIDESFFDLGGHSLLAVQLVHAIEAELGRTCTLAMLFRSGTIRGLAAELHAGGPDSEEATVLQLATGNGPPLFCICGVHAYQELADTLKLDLPVYGIFLPAEQRLFAAEGRKRPTLTIEDMAADYLKAIRERQPTGPYLLLGFCFGGFLAYEIARQLAEADEEVSMLVMLDSVLRRAVAPTLKRSMRNNAKRLRQRILDVTPERMRALVGRSERTLTQTERLDRIRVRIYRDAMRRYVVRPYGGPTVLVRPDASRTAGVIVDPTYGWGPHVAELELVDVPGAHISHLKSPNVRTLAAGLTPHIARARAERNFTRG
jgi:amino acid adenylation domain-containing protein